MKYRYCLLLLLLLFVIVCFIFCHLSSVEGGQCISSPLDYLQDVHVEEGEGGKGQDVQEHGAEQEDLRDNFENFQLGLIGFIQSSLEVWSEFGT